jgi:iron complex transport system substrate-binding protein
MTEWTRRAVLAGAAAFPVSDAVAASPRRVVSLNPCLDVILVRVAERAQILALSHYSREPQSSSIADIAKTLPVTYESAEEIITLRPDLVLASQHSGLATRQALTRLGVEVATFGVPGTVEDSLAQIRDVAVRVGRAEAGEAVIAQVREALRAAAPTASKPRVRALVFQAGGLVAGRDTLVGEVMQSSGFENVGARYGVTSWGTLSLERLIADPPDLLLSAEPRPGTPTWAERVLSHPALARVADRMKRAEFPATCMYCGGPVLIETAQALVRARDAYWSAA